MTPDDRDDVAQIDRDAFELYRRRQRQLTRTLTLRTPDNIDAAFGRQHPGVVIEWPPGTVAGYCFTHVWGSMGWLGTLGVTPRHQGIGLGHLVIAGGLELLVDVGCRVLALETMPESGKNLALYTRLNLEARQLTMLCQGVPPRAEHTTFELWDETSDDLARVAGALVPGLDPTPAAQWLLNEDAGDTLVWHAEGEPVAFAALRSAARRLEQGQGYLTVEVAGCLPRVAEQWPRYLGEMQHYAESIRKSGLVLPINARQQTLLRMALDARLRIVHTRVRMALGPLLGAPDAMLMMTLAM